MRASKTFSHIFKLLTGVIVFDLALSVAWAWHVLQNVPYQENSGHFDVVIILFADFNSDYSGLGAESQRRLNHSLTLSKLSGIDNILTIGGSRPTHNILGAELMKDFLENRGVPPNRLHADGSSYDTLSNWQDAQIIIDANNWGSVGIVSSAFHLHRLGKHLANSVHDFDLSLLPYSFTEATPDISPLEMWRSVHYEWLTYTLYQLPRPIYSAILSFIRPQQA